MIGRKTSRHLDRPNPPRPWLMAIALTALSLSARAAPGDIDTRFGDGGRVASGGSAIPLPNGGLAVGRNWVYGFEVEFLDAQGRPNPGLGSGGRTVVTLPPVPKAYFGTHSLRMPDGGLVFAGWVPDGNGSGAKTVHALLRLTPRGDVDPAFGTAGNGIAQLGSTSVIVGLAPQADGRLLVALLDGTLEGDEMGFSCVSATYRISRLLRDGSVDPGYGVDGMLAVPDLASADCLAPTLFATDATGAAVIGDRLRLRRITPNGQVDMGFGWPAGVAVPPFKGEILGGVMTSTGVLLLHSDEAFGRLSPDGRVDPAFGGGDGVLPLWEDGGGVYLDRVGRVALTPDGRHVYVQSEVSEDYMGDRICQVVLRMSIDGAVDNDFGSKGRSCFSFGRVSAGRPLVLDNGQPVLDLGERGAHYFYRLLVDSTPSGGALSLKVNFNSSVVDEVSGSVSFTVVRSAGKDGFTSVSYTTLAGTARPGSDYVESSGMLEWTPGDTSERTVTVKILQDSVVEGSETFSLELRGAEGGIVIGVSQTATIAEASSGAVTPPPVVTPTPPDGPSSGGGGAADWIVALLMFLAGTARARCGGRSAARSAPIAAALCLGMALAQGDAHAAGSVDPTFGSSGVLRPQPASGHGLFMVAPLSGDRFLMLTCPMDYGCYGGLGLRRFVRDGKLDTTFGESGVATFDAQPSYPVIVMDRADGALLLAGDEASRAGFLMAVSASGQPDPVFGGQSVLRFPQPVRALAVQSDGKLLVATAPDSSECQSAGWTLQRLSAFGVIDPTFGTAGATTSFAVEGAVLRNCGLTQIWEQPGGDIVIQTSAGLRRLRSDGSLDTTFGTANGLTPTKGTVTRTADGRFLDISGQLAAWSVRRHDVNGREDPSFGSGGVVDLYVAAAMADFRSVDGFWVNRIEAIEDGAWYVASMQIEGRLQSTGEWLSGTFIVRFLSDGRVDATFGKGGKVAMSRSGYLGDSGLFAQSDGKLVVAAGGAIYRLLSDNAPSPGFVIMGPAEPVAVVEGGRARVIVSRTGGAGTAISVSYHTVAQDALAELDFTPVTGRLSWAAGDDSDRVVEVTTVDDAIYDDSEEGLEFFVLGIAPAEGAPVITSAEQWIAIADNDPPPVVTPPPPPTPAPTPQATPGGGGGAIGLVEAVALLGALAVGLRRRRVMLALRPRDRRWDKGIRHGQFRRVMAQDSLHHLRAQLWRGGADRRAPHHEDPGRRRSPDLEGLRLRKVAAARLLPERRRPALLADAPSARWQLRSHRLGHGDPRDR